MSQNPHAEQGTSPPKALDCPSKFSPKYIARAWSLIAADGEPREVRILKTEKDGTVSGIFTDGEAVASAIAKWDGVRSIYLTVNPLKPEMLARENVGKLTRWTRDTTADADIASRKWFIADIDPVTPVKGVSATSDERERALVVREILAAWLEKEFDFPEPIRGSSGNGGRLLCAIDLPNDAESTDLIKRCLQALAHQFGNAKVTIDTGVFNASRVDKIWGTIAVKGQSTADRPHRRAYLDVVPKPIRAITREQLQALAALAPAARTTPSKGASPDAGEDFPVLLDAIRAKGLYLKQAGERHFIVCPWKDAHSVDSGPSETALYEPAADNGFAGGFKCQHSHCTERKIGEVYKLFIAQVPKPILGTGGSVGGFLPDAKPDADDPGGERYTDVLCARLLGEPHADVLRHADEMKAMWHHWDAVRLGVQNEGVVFPYIAAVAQALFAESLSEENQVKEEKDDPHAARAKMLWAAAMRLESLAGLRSVATVAREHPKLKISMAQLDQHPLWLNTPGTTLDLETGKAWPNRIEDLITKVTGARYDPKATCPKWLAFLERMVPDLEVRAFLQRSVGYSLTDDTSERCLWFFYGIGRNGKSTFLDVMRDMLGDYASNTAASTLMVKSHGDDRRNDIAILRGARFVSASESEEGQRLAESLIKQLAGGEDKVTARLMYAEFFSFKPTFKIFLATNAKPVIRGTDQAIWDRIHLVPFEVRLSEEQIDRGLAAKLKAERDGILNWALDGYRAWRAQGLRAPKAVVEATAEYRREMDHLGGFIEERCMLLDAVSGAAGQVYVAYRDWAEANGIRLPMTQKAMSLNLKARGFESKKDGRGVMVWIGLGLKPVGGAPTEKASPERVQSAGPEEQDDLPF